MKCAGGDNIFKAKKELVNKEGKKYRSFYARND